MNAESNFELGRAGSVSDRSGTAAPDAAPHATSAAAHARFAASAGTIALFFAAAVFVLAVVDRAQPLPFMPMSWYANRALWYLLAFGSLLGGVFLLRTAGREAVVESTSPPHDGLPVFESLVFYTRQGCHLCDEALNVLKQHQQYLPPIQIIDIDADPSLHERFDTCVPVVEIDGKVRFRGHVNRVLLQRMVDVELGRRELRVES